MHEQYLALSNYSNSGSCLQTYVTESLVQALQGSIEWKDFLKHGLVFTWRSYLYYAHFCTSRITSDEVVDYW